MFKFILATAFIFSSPVFAKVDTKSTQEKVEISEVSKSNELTVGVKGMVCAFCAQGIEKKFSAQPEVAKVHVSLENKFVKLTFKEGQRLSNEKIKEILKDAGYEASFGEK